MGRMDMVVMKNMLPRTPKAHLRTLMQNTETDQIDTMTKDMLQMQSMEMDQTDTMVMAMEDMLPIRNQRQSMQMDQTGMMVMMRRL